MLKSIILAACLVAVACGCVAPQSQTSADARLRADLMLLREDLVRVQGRSESLDSEYQRLIGEIDALNNAVARMGDRAERMERDIVELRTARTKDREMIIDELSARVSKLLAGARAAPGGAMTGYEHTVQAGETLSEIAAAYKVRASAIIEANNLENPDLLRQGQKLFIPR